MYESILTALQSPVSKNKSGTVEIRYKYGDTARIYLKNGEIEQIETTKTQGMSAASTCVQWLSFTSSFNENNQGNYIRDDKLSSSIIMKFLNKMDANIRMINELIPHDGVIFEFNSSKLQDAGNIKPDDFKLALLFNGQRTVAEALEASGQPEYTFLAKICKLILPGVLGKVAGSTGIAGAPSQGNKKIFDQLNQKIMDLVGPAGSILVEEAMQNLGISDQSLDATAMQRLLPELIDMLEPEDRDALQQWGKQFMNDTA
jgi:hypothetical protein